MKPTLTEVISNRNWQTVPTLSNFHGHLRYAVRRCVDDYDWLVTQRTVWLSAGGGAFATVRRALLVTLRKEN